MKSKQTTRKGAANSFLPLLGRYICLVSSLWLVIVLALHNRLEGADEPSGGGGLHRKLRAYGTTSTSTNIATSRNDSSTSSISSATRPIRSTKDGLSACLLVNDENPRLPEWIAYHYHTLPLRSLTVAVDPASRLSPAEILMRWNGTSLGMGMEVQMWNDIDYLPEWARGVCRDEEHGGGPCDEHAALRHHRNRQMTFVLRCMADFKSRNKTWVLLVDVDEYITFNQVRDDDPAAPLEEAPEGIPTLIDWYYYYGDNFVEGEISGVPPDGTGKVKNGDAIETETLITKAKDVQPGNVITDTKGNRYYLRDDLAFRDKTALREAPPGVPTLREVNDEDDEVGAYIYNDTYDNNEDGEWVDIEMNWTRGETTGDKTFHGGHLMQDLEGRRYYFEWEQALWPPLLPTKDAMAARRRMPSVGEGRTILDVLESEAKEDYTQGSFGPCLSMPRLLYGSHENKKDPSWKDMAPEGFKDNDFVTLRYRWHATKGTIEVNKFGKNVIDVSRVPMETFSGEGQDIHQPLIYYCRRDVPRYVISLLRVNHYLDSFEAYSYRNDARSSTRQCRECYDKKGRGAVDSMDDDVRPWLASFVESVGRDNAEKLLANAGSFTRLS